MNETIDYALRYLAKGFSVIPLQPKDKKPAIASWKEYQTRRATEAELREWFSHSDFNLGIVTGEISGIHVIDCDGLPAVRKAAELGIPTCPTVKTGKGYHFYCAANGIRSNFQKREDLPGIDFRGDGGYVVAPPSIHPSGEIYTWEGFDRDLPILPSWLSEEKSQQSKEKINFKDLYKGVGAGNRNQTLARLAGVWAKHLAFEEIIEMAVTWNSFNEPPMEDLELRRTVESIFKKEKSKSSPSASAVIDNEIIGIETLTDKINHLYRNGITRGESPGWDVLKNYYTVRRGEWTLVTGIPGHGKTEFLDNLLINLAKKSNWKFGIFSAENLPHERHLAGLTEKLIGKPFMTGPRERINESELEKARSFLSQHFWFINPKEEERSVQRIISITKKLIVDYKIDGIVIDPWNELDHARPEGFLETEYISISLSEIRRFCRMNNIHCWIVAHPAKLQRSKEDGTYPVPTPYDVSGSAHWRNKADNIICVWRDTAKDLPTMIYIQKIRFKEIGKIGVVNMNYDIPTGKFSESEEDRKFYSTGDYYNSNEKEIDPDKI